MHEFPYNPPDSGLSRGTPLFPFRPTEKHRSHSLQRKAFICELLARPCGFVRADVPCVLLRRSRHLCVRSLFPRSSCLACCTDRVANRRADGIRAMPSARALLVASLLTEPPYGCLGPSGNDRYRKRSLRSQTAGASQVNCQVAAAHSQ
jgi:hypothetical protein